MKDPTTQKIIEANPELKTKGCTQHWDMLPQRGCVPCVDTIYKEITLANVLITIDKISNEAVVMDTRGRITDIRIATANGFHGAIQWNLLQDWEHQSPEVKEFVGRLLGVEPLPAE